MFISAKNNEEAAQAISEASETAEKKPALQASFTNSLSGKAGGELIAHYLDTHPKVEELLLHNCPIGDEGMKLLASAIARHPAIQKFKATDSALSPEGVADFFQKGGFTLKMVDFALQERQSPESNEAIKAHMSRIESKNLLEAGGATTPEVKQLTDNNNIKNTLLIERLIDSDIKSLSLHELRSVHARKDSLFYYEDMWHDVFSEVSFRNSDGEEDAAFISSRFAYTYDDLEACIESMPGLPDKPDIASLFVPNETGFAPLDNPCLWDGKTLEDFAAIPLTQKNLNSRTPKGSSLLDSAVAAFSAEDLIPHLNSRGIQLQETYLLDKEGKPTEIFERIIDDGKPAALFTPENWLGASRQQILRVHQALPEEQKSRISIHRLQATVESAITRQGVGR